MPVSIGPRIQVDGEEEYRRQINGIIEQSKTLDAEMKAMAAGFSDTATEQEKAAAASGKLAEQLELARRRTELVREMTEKSAEATGENSTQTLKWRQALAAAEEQQATLEHAVEENTRAIDAQGDEMADSSTQMVGWGDTLNDIGDKLGIRIPQAATDALNGIDAFSVGTVAQMAAVAGGAAAAYKGIEALVDITLEAAEKADALLTRSAQTGIDAETLQGLDYASNFLDFEGIDQSLVKLTASMDKARDGAEKQAEAFAALGVSVTDADGELKNNYDTFLEVIDALGKVENATERDALANNLFGKSYSELKPLIDAGSKSLQAFMDKAKQTGIVLTEDQVKKLGEVDDAHQELQAQIEATKNKIAVEFAPATKAAMDTFANAVQKGGDALTNSGIISGIGSAVESVLALVDAGARLVNSLPDWINPLENVSRQFEGLAIAASLVADAVDLVSGLMPWNWGSGQATTALGWNIDQGQMSHFQQYKYRDGIAYNAAGDMDWRGGLTWVGESGPELVSLPQGSAIYSNQESRQIAAAATDTSRIESLLERCLQRMDGIERELADGEAVRRMA